MNPKEPTPAGPRTRRTLALLLCALRGAGTGARAHRRVPRTLAVSIGMFGVLAAPALASPPETPEVTGVGPLTPTTATLEGVLNPNAPGLPGSFQFSYAPSETLECANGSLAPVPPQIVIGGLEKEPVSTPVTGLQPDREYAVCLTAFSFFAEPSEPSAAVAFKTLAAPPGVDSESTSGVTSTAATLEAQLNPNNQSSSYSFEYSTEESAGKLQGTIETVSGAGSLEGFGDQSASVPTGALLPGTTYFYRVVAENEQSESEGTPATGAVRTFTTVATPKTEAVTEVTATTATFNGTLTPLTETPGAEAEYFFAYNVGSEDCQGASVTSVAGAGTGTGPQAVATPVTELQPGVSYSVCLVSQNAFGSEVAPQVQFTTPAAAPRVDSESTSNLTPFSATLEAQVNPDNQATSYSFEYSTSESGGVLTGSPVRIKGGPALEGYGDQQAFAPTGHVLTPGSEYFFRVVAVNAAHETTDGPVEPFTAPTAAAPVIEGESSSGVTAEKARLEASVNPGFQETTCVFEYGTEASLEHPTLVPCKVPLGTGGAGVPASVDLAGLESSSTYYYRVAATNASGTSTEPPVESFETAAATAPLIEEPSVTAVSATAATLNAKLNPGGLATTYTFELAIPAGTPFKPVAEPEGNGTLPEGTSPVAISVHVQHGLAPNTAYEFRLVAHNALETVTSEPVSFTTQRPGGELVLPDARQWEMVTPPDKHGTDFYGYRGNNTVIQASVDGDALIDQASQPSEPEPQGYNNETQVLLTRGPSGWSSQSLQAPRVQASGPAGTLGLPQEYHFFSADLSHGVAEPYAPFLALSPWASEQTPYLRTDYLGGNVSAHCEASYLSSSSCFQPLVSGCPAAGECSPAVEEHADVPRGTQFGEEFDGQCNLNQRCGPEFVDASPDLSHIVLRSCAALTANATGLPESECPRDLVWNYYEFSAGQLQLLPGPLAGQQHVANSLELEPGKQHQISQSGQRVLLVGAGGALDLRDTGTETTTEVGLGTFQTASADDSRIFFAAPSGELYEYDLEGERLSDLTPGEPAQVVGASEDGTYVYFTTAAGVHLSHDGATTLIAPAGPTAEDARVSPDGRWLAFMSSEDLTGYDTRDASSGQPDQEVYLYGADSGSLVCASCDPTGARPNVPPGIDLPIAGIEGGSVAAGIPGPHNFVPAKYQARYLADGGRLFFDSAIPLVPQATNGRQDVYEYEPEGFQSSLGTTQCSSESATFSNRPTQTVEEGTRERAGGCVDLISSGTSSTDSAFLDASEDGSDVFFITTAKLSPQDRDTAYDVYDAHECTTASPCISPPAEAPAPCNSRATCVLSGGPQPAPVGTPASGNLSGPGNLAPLPPTSSGAKPKTAAQIRAEKLAKALRACRAKHNKRKRQACEKAARKAFGAKASAKKSTTAKRPTTDRRPN